MNRSQKLAQELGMPFGTACNRFRKNILFHLLKKINENICFKCGNIIENVSDLSIEHKQPWESRDVALFWDIENIAFSHMKCNRPHSVSGKKYFTREEKLEAVRKLNAAGMRRRYTTEKRREKKQRTGW
jgi:5-methylcytosine-specific restriction endonuclease McrA